MSSPAATPGVVGPAQASRATPAVAWVGTLALSELLEVVLVEAVGIDAPQMPWIWLALAVLLVAAAGIWRSCGWPAIPETTRGEAAAGWSATTPIMRILSSSSPG
jgi:hypothetical protein